MQSENQLVSHWRDNKRLAMKRFPFHPVIWSSFLIVWVSQCGTEDNDFHVCSEDRAEELIVQSSSSEEYSLELHEVNETFSCRLYPTNMLNCSWSFHTLTNEKLSVYISICRNGTTGDTWRYLTEEKAGSQSWILPEHLSIHVIIQFNMSLPDKWKFYSYMYEMDILEVLPPPSNISASVIGEQLLVTWDLPVSRTTTQLNQKCIEYELDLGDQERVKHLTNVLSYTELNVPTHTYRVRIRTKIMNSCFGGPHWSDWSHTVTVNESVYKLNMLVIISISLGIPMILLTVLLLVRHQRVSELLFPPIPRPPQKYIHYVEKNDTPSLFYPALPAKVEEEITEVEDTEENMEKTI